MLFILILMIAILIKYLIHEIKELKRILKGNIKEEDFDDFILK